MTRPENTKLGLHDDGTVTIPVIGGDDPREITLHEPSAGEQEDAFKLIVAAQEKLKELAPDPGPVREALINSGDSPPGQALVEIIRQLSGEEVALRDLPGWALTGDALIHLRKHWDNPLHGDELRRRIEKLGLGTGNGAPRNREERRAAARATGQGDGGPA